MSITFSSSWFSRGFYEAGLTLTLHDLCSYKSYYFNLHEILEKQTNYLMVELNLSDKSF